MVKARESVRRMRTGGELIGIEFDHIVHCGKSVQPVAFPGRKHDP